MAFVERVDRRRYFCKFFIVPVFRHNGTAGTSCLKVAVQAIIRSLQEKRLQRGQECLPPGIKGAIAEKTGLLKAI